jgi:hypothetical protein
METQIEKKGKPALDAAVMGEVVSIFGLKNRKWGRGFSWLPGWPNSLKSFSTGSVIPF